MFAPAQPPRQLDNNNRWPHVVVHRHEERQATKKHATIEVAEILPWPKRDKVEETMKFGRVSNGEQPPSFFNAATGISQR